MGFTYPDKFTYLNTFMMKMAQRCLDNGGPTVPYNKIAYVLALKKKL